MGTISLINLPPNGTQSGLCPSRRWGGLGFSSLPGYIRNMRKRNLTPFILLFSALFLSCSPGGSRIQVSFFQYDQSFQFNDWFPGAPYYIFDQPPVLYRAEIDLSRGAADYSLEPVGFVPMYDSYPDMVLTPADKEAVKTARRPSPGGSFSKRWVTSPAPGSPTAAGIPPSGRSTV